ncbi:hypothetical protein H0E87_028650 [Populus deltoides]|uniref:PRISE-like Rossmann-fold domain-containing protein n=1 Tax=Populus deltoides TaxID=3696 RepID=A0A8T2WU44_POPDE|nr:hypothetical protein H0E87_028650 [Populus deltoides]
MEKENSSDASVALIVGITGLAGFSLAEALQKPTTPGRPWKVYGIARRPLPRWFPAFLVDGFISLDALDCADTANKLSPVAHEITHVFWVSMQHHGNEEVNISMNSTMLANVLNALKSTAPSRLRHVTLLTGTKHYMGPIFDPSLRGQLVHQEPPFKEDLGRLPCPNFYYALEDLVASYLPSITHSVHRSSIIIGASSRSPNDTLLTLSVYATICRYQGLPFRYPGNKYTWEHFCDMSDARVLAEQQIWAAVTEGAKNQAFNCTNGDVFTWKSLWGVLCEVFDVEFVAFEENDEKFDWLGDDKGMNKSRESGFLGFADTLKSIPMWASSSLNLRQKELEQHSYLSSGKMMPKAEGIGASSRSVDNILLTLSVHATICQYQGLPFRYPGNKYTWEHFCDMSDARVLAEQQKWAAVTDGAKNQAFNCTNGDVFTWKSSWKVLFEVVDVGFVAMKRVMRSLIGWG